MGYVKIQIKDVAKPEDLKRWEEHMLENAKCWNKFCLGIYGEHEMRAVHIIKEGEQDNIFLTTLCEDCIKDTTGNEILINENHLMVEVYKEL